MAISNEPPKPDARSEQRPAVGNQPFIIPEAEIPKLQDEALGGSGAAAYRLAQYYSFAVFDHGLGLHWMKVAAENGDVRGVYGLGMTLSKSSDRQDRLRAKYWLEKAAREAQDPIASLARALLKDMGDPERR